ncbi:MAG: restriction endonuclease subunit S [Lachnospiraceae bacterium]|nr:restriction endonuclease subunit S [Lachnospiraceae bacterium]
MEYQPYGGSAPSEWREVTLDDVCDRITDGSHYSPADAPDFPYPMYSVKDMETYGFNSSSCKHITAEEFHKMQKNDCVPKLNDILVAKDGSYLKEIFICSEEKDEAILSSIAIFRPNTEIVMPEILLYLLKQPSVRKDVADNYVSGSALPRIVLKDFKKYTFLLPPMTEQVRIGSFLHSICMQIKANINEIQSLSALRDALLPRLMSGELDVSNLDL